MMSRASGLRPAQGDAARSTVGGYDDSGQLPFIYFTAGLADEDHGLFGVITHGEGF
jgi:hypothetical protein